MIKLNGRQARLSPIQAASPAGRVGQRVADRLRTGALLCGATGVVIGLEPSGGVGARDCMKRMPAMGPGSCWPRLALTLVPQSVPCPP